MTKTLDVKPTSEAATAGSTSTDISAKRSAQRQLAKAPSWWQAIVGNLIWSIGTLAIAIVLLELGFRACGVGGEEYFKHDPVVGLGHLENKQIFMRSEGWSNDYTNPQGNRDIEHSLVAAAGTRRIAFLGDSKTESLQVPLKDNFVSLIERRLNAKAPAKERFECFNFGMSDYGTGQELIQFIRDVKQYKPEVTVLVYHVLDNDENTANATQEVLYPKPYFTVSDDGHLNPEWYQLDAWLCSDRAAYFRTFDWLRRNSHIWGVFSMLDSGLASDKTYQFYCKRILSPMLKLTAALPSSKYRPDQTTNDLRSSINKEISQSIPRFGTTCEEKLPEDRNNPGFNQNEYKVLLLNHRLHFRVTASLIRRLNAICAENGSKLVLAALPAPNNSIFYFRELVALEQLARDENFAFINMHNRFPQVAPGESSPEFINFHFSRTGHRLVADLLTPTIEDELARQ